MSRCRASHTAVGSMGLYNSLAKCLGHPVEPCTSHLTHLHSQVAASDDELHSTCVVVISWLLSARHLYSKSTRPSTVAVSLTLIGCNTYGEEPSIIRQCLWLEITSRCCVNSYFSMSSKASHAPSFHWGGQRGVACEEHNQSWIHHLWVRSPSAWPLDPAPQSICWSNSSSRTACRMRRSNS